MSSYEEIEDDRPQRFDAGLWKRVLSHARPYKGPLVGLAASGMIMAAADVGLPLVTGWVIDGAIGGGDRSDLVRNSLYYLALVAIIAGLVWFFIVMARRTATGYAHDIRQKSFAHLQDLSFSFYDRRPIGWLMARLTSDCDRLSSIIPWALLDGVWGTSLLIGITVMMLVLNWKLALLVLLIVPPLAFASVIFQRKLLRSQRQVRKSNSRITAAYNEGIMGVRTSKTLVREDENLSEFRSLTGEMYGHSVRNALQAAIYLPLVITLGSVGVGLALWKGGISLGAISQVVPGVEPDMTMGTLVAFMQYAALFYIPIQEMAERFTQMQAAQASAERLQDLLDTESDVQDTEAVKARLAATGTDGHDEPIREITFDNVNFAYIPEEPVLSDFNLVVNEGETIALVGATGSGKSTIVSLLCRFYEPTGGVIRINGSDYRDWSLHGLQSNLGMVLQTPHLFSGTIRDNIRYGRLEATDEEVEAAAKLVNAADFIEAFEDGYETGVGEGGSRLSTGQKQLVSLARAVLADPRIFVMDEATSSVDTETERLIQEAIEQVLEGRISFVIAHRLSTIRNADRILVIDRGRMIEQGSHAELIASGGRYYELYTNQFAREAEDQVIEAGFAERSPDTQTNPGAA